MMLHVFHTTVNNCPILSPSKILDCVKVKNIFEIYFLVELFKSCFNFKLAAAHVTQLNFSILDLADCVLV
jgi:hypothetical protein